MPSEQEETKHSFSVSCEAGQGPQELTEAGPGYVVLEANHASKLLARELRARRRQRKMKSRRSQRYYIRKKAQEAVLKAPVHPTVSREEALAVEEAAGLA